MLVTEKKIKMKKKLNKRKIETNLQCTSDNISFGPETL